MGITASRLGRSLILAAWAALAVATVARAEDTILSEGFEGAFPGSWSVGDDNPSGTDAYWDDCDSGLGGEGAHSGSWKGYCADIGNAGTYDNPLYQPNMEAHLTHTIDLTGYTSATLSFWYKIPSIESYFDGCHVYIDSDEVWFRDTPQTSWTEAVIDLTPYAGGVHTLSFVFTSDGSVQYEGWYLDDILVTASGGSTSPPDHITPSLEWYSELNCSGDATENAAVDWPDDTDVWMFVADNSGNVTVTVDPDSSLDVMVGVYDSNGDRIDWADSGWEGSPETVTVPVSSWTKYYIWIGSYQAATSGDYTLSIDAPTATIGTVSEGSSVSVTIDAVEDTDYYQFTPSTTYTPTIELTGQDFDAVLSLYDSGGNLLQRADDPEMITHTVIGGATYCIRVGSYHAGSSGTCTLTVSPPPLPDLHDDGQLWCGFSPTTVQPGQAFSAWCDVRNSGGSASGSFAVDFYASTNTTIRTVDYFLGRVNMSSIAPGDYASCDLNLASFPSSVPPGTYYIGWIIDADDDVAESDEGNNVEYDHDQQLTVITPPPYIFDSYVQSLTGTDADGDGRYESASFDIAIDADIDGNATTQVEARVTCTTTGDSWMVPPWTITDYDIEYGVLHLEWPGDFNVPPTAQPYDLDFTVELIWPVGSWTVVDTDTSVVDEPVLVEVGGEPYIWNSYVQNLTGTDADGDGRYESASFDIAIDADIDGNATTQVEARVTCTTTGDSWMVPPWTITDYDIEYGVLHLDWPGNFNVPDDCQPYDLDFTVELIWPVGSGTVVDTDTGVEDEPVPVEIDKPDLVVEPMTHTPEPSSPGDTVTFTVTVRNQGNIDAGLFNVGFWSGCVWPCCWRERGPRLPGPVPDARDPPRLGLCGPLGGHERG